MSTPVTLTPPTFSHPSLIGRSRSETILPATQAVAGTPQASNGSLAGRVMSPDETTSFTISLDAGFIELKFPKAKQPSAPQNSPVRAPSQNPEIPANDLK